MAIDSGGQRAGRARRPAVSAGVPVLASKITAPGVPGWALPRPRITTLIAEGRRHLLLGEMIETGCPVRILQGVQDPDVPWSHAVELTSRLAQDDVVLTLVKDGDHRLSRPEDIDRLIRAVAEL